MDTRAFLIWLGPPSLFIMLCMTAVGWIGSISNRKFAGKLWRWVIEWGALGCFLATSSAIVAWMMETDFVYSHVSMVWPFRLSLIVLDGHPSIAIGLLLACVMGLVNGLYYAVMAALTWAIIQLVPHDVSGLSSRLLSRSNGARRV